MSSVRKKDKKIEHCFYCNCVLIKGKWTVIHDNIFNKVNPKKFCCKDHKLFYIFRLKPISLLDYIETKAGVKFDTKVC